MCCCGMQLSVRTGAHQQKGAAISSRPIREQASRSPQENRVINVYGPMFKSKTGEKTNGWSAKHYLRFEARTLRTFAAGESNQSRIEKPARASRSDARGESHRVERCC